MSDIIVEVNVENGLPGSKWNIRPDPRYLLAVVHKLRECTKKGAPFLVPGIDKFSATWDDGYVNVEIPVINGNQEMFLFVLTQTLESMAKVKIETEWGAKFLETMIAKPTIAMPGGQMVL